MDLAKAIENDPDAPDAEAIEYVAPPPATGRYHVEPVPPGKRQKGDWWYDNGCICTYGDHGLTIYRVGT